MPPQVAQEVIRRWSKALRVRRMRKTSLLGGSSSVINKGLNQGDRREEGIESKEQYSLKFHKPKGITVE